MTTALGRKASIENVSFNPFSLAGEIKNFRLADKGRDKELFSFSSLRFNVQAASLFKLAIVTKSVSLDNPVVDLVLHKDLSWNFSDLAGSGSQEKENKNNKDKSSLLFSINNIEINHGRILFNDQVKGIKHDISDIHLAVPYISNLPNDIEIFIQPAFSANVNGTVLGLNGSSKPFVNSRSSEFNINFTDIDLTGYLVYLPPDLGFTIKNALLDLNLTLSFMQQEDGRPAIKIIGKTGLRKVDIRDRDDLPLLNFSAMEIDLDQTHIMGREFNLAGFSLTKPELFIRRLNNGKINLASLLPTPEAVPEQQEETSPAKNLILNIKETVVHEATIHYSDLSRATPFETTLSPVEIKIKNFGLKPENMADFSLDLTTESAEKLKISGKFSPIPLKVEAEVELNNIKPGKYRPYYENSLVAEIAADQADFKANLALSPDNFKIFDISCVLDRFTATRDTKVIIDKFSINAGEVDLTEKKIIIGRCASSGGIIPLVHRHDGSLNLQDFITPKPASAESKNEPDSNKEKSGWSWLLRKLEFSDYSCLFSDQDPAQKANFAFEQLHLNAENISNNQAESGKINLGMIMNKKGKIKAAGSLTPAPLDLNIELALHDLPLKDCQPYVTEYLNIFINKGSGQIDGNLRVNGRNTPASLDFQGSLASTGLDILDSETGNLLSWKNFKINRLAVSSSSTTSIAAQAVIIDGLQAKIEVDRDGALNLTELSKAETASSPAPKNQTTEKKPKKTLKTTIELVDLKDCRIDFADHSLSPQFNAALEDIQGRITGLSSSKDVQAIVDIKATLNQHSPLTIKGKIHPWADFFTDITVDLHDMDLNPLSPYSSKFIAYPLDKGKLSLDLHYLIEGKKLTSDNSVFLDQITLGDHVQNDTAVNLPVSLAISLLKNRAGEINLDIPVSGQLDDPEFSVAGVIFTVLKNLLVKAATSPFALLGSLFPSDRDFLYVEFLPGTTKVKDKDEKKWKIFARALYDHPALKLDITPFVDPEKDGRSLRKFRFERLLKREKMRDLLKKKQTVPEVDKIEISPEEYDHYLTRAYKAAEFDRPRNFIGLLKKLPPAEMAELLNDNIAVTSNDLRQLGIDRAELIKDFLVTSGPVEPERIFMLEPQQLSTATPDGLSSMRVEIMAR